MKVSEVRLDGRALASAAIAAAFLATALVTSPAPAQAITRGQIIARAKSWIAKRIPYSQRRYHGGYRQDCSGFVSMAWGLRRSITSRTISSVSRRISIASLKPGDAVWKPGHVSIFGGWKNRSRREYYALEQTTWGSHAMRRVRTIPPNGRAYRYKRLTTPAPRPVATRPATTVATAPSADATLSAGGAVAASARD